jgi:hypothetical protein
VAEIFGAEADNGEPPRRNALVTESCEPPENGAVEGAVVKLWVTQADAGSSADSRPLRARYHRQIQLCR